MHNLNLGFDVKGRGRFIKNQDWRVTKNSTSNRYALALSTRQILALFAYQAVVSAQIAQNHLVNVRLFRRLDNFVIIGSRFPYFDVFTDGALKQHRVL